MAGTAAASALADANWSVAYGLLSETPLEDLTCADLDQVGVPGGV